MQQSLIDWCNAIGYPLEKVTPKMEVAYALMEATVQTASAIIEYTKNAPNTIPIGSNTRYGKYQKAKVAIWSAGLAITATMGAVRHAQIISQPIPRKNYE